MSIAEKQRGRPREATPQIQMLGGMDDSAAGADLQAQDIAPTLIEQARVAETLARSEWRAGHLQPGSLGLQHLALSSFYGSRQRAIMRGAQ